MQLETRQQVLNDVIEVVNSNRTSKYQAIVNSLDEDYGALLLASGVSDDVLNVLRPFNFMAPREAMYIWQNIYQFLCKQERESKKRLCLASLYFYMAEAMYQSRGEGYGKYYLKAYVEDLGFHGTPEAGGAIQQLVARCGLGMKGVRIIHQELMKIVGVPTLGDLRTVIHNSSRGEFEQITIELENRLALESNDDFFVPVTALQELIEKIEPEAKKKASGARGVLLEELCQVLFGSIKGFRYKLDERSRHFQLDGVITNDSSNPFLQDLGRNIIVEAKQYFHRTKIPRKIVDQITMNMVRTNATCTFLVTTAMLGRPAREEIHHVYLRDGKYILLLSLADIKDIAEDKVSIPILISKKISDIRSARV